MPPKSRPCCSRSTTPFQSYIDKADKAAGIKKQIVAALKKNGYLMKFDKASWANECVFSYPNLDWYSIYLKDPDGNIYWDSEEKERSFKYYFKVEPVGEDFKVVEGTTRKPDEITDDRNCVISANGNCVNPAKLGKEKAVKDSPATLPEITSKLKEIKVGSDPGPSSKKTEKVDRDYFEGMSKEKIVTWMLGNMDVNDIHSCIQRGRLSAADIAAADKIASEYNKESKVENIEEIINTVDQMNRFEIDTLIKKISTEELTKMIKGKDRTEWKKTLVPICRKNGIETAGLSLDRLFGQCVSAESARLKMMLASAIKMSGQRDLSRKLGPVKELTKDALLSNEDNKLVPLEYLGIVQKYFPIIKDLKGTDTGLSGKFPVPEKLGKYYGAINIKFKNLKNLQNEIDKGIVKSAFGKKKFKRAAKEWR